VLVDAGWDSPEALDELSAALAAAGARMEDLVGLLVTHIHPDHYGLASRIREASGCWVAMHGAEAALIRDRYVEIGELLDRIEDWLVDVGAPRADLDDLGNASIGLLRHVRAVRPDRLVEEGDISALLPGRTIEAIHTPGHSPGHLCFYDRAANVLLSGDHVLPRITPNVSFHPQSGPDPLAQFLAALEKLRRYDGAFVLPSHERPFDGLGRRIDELIAHHEARLDEAVALVADGAETIWEVAVGFAWSNPWSSFSGFMRRAALGEAHAHMITLAERGRLRVESGAPLRWRVG
jgi:glyoxylase-like metal-dependent hydrolase (beta-lactamase superfamily II)